MHLIKKIGEKNMQIRKADLESNYLNVDWRSMHGHRLIVHCWSNVKNANFCFVFVGNKKRTECIVNMFSLFDCWGW